MKLSTEILAGFHCPRWSELPAIPLYMDQVIIVLEDSIGIFAGPGEKVVTSSMINNYVKQRLLNAPEKKRYARKHLAALIVISIMKKVLAMQEINHLIKICRRVYGVEKAYDLFCEKLEAYLAQVFTKAPVPEAVAVEGRDPETDRMMDTALQALAWKLQLEVYLPDPPEEKAE